MVSAGQGRASRERLVTSHPTGTLSTTDREPGAFRTAPPSRWAGRMLTWYVEATGLRFRSIPGDRLLDGHGVEWRADRTSDA